MQQHAIDYVIFTGMLNAKTIIPVLIFLAACTNVEAPDAGFSRISVDSLRNFVLNSANLGDDRRRLQLDTLLTIAAKDSTHFRQTVSLYAITANRLLLFFYNPECNACKEMKAALLASTIITQQAKTGSLQVLAVYTDKDESTWRKHLPQMPANWLHGRDEDEYLYKHHIYNLKAIPTLYLLDKNKIVLLKDAMNIQAIEEKLLPR